MKCPSCSSYASGSFCKTCGEVLIEKPQKSKGINKVSEKMQKTLKEYTKLKKQFLNENPYCVVFPKLKAIDIHHQSGKLGDMYLNTDYWLPVSRQGHILIENNPNWSKENGYSISRLAINKDNENS